MHYSTILLALASSVSASVLPRQTTSEVFNITNFVLSSSSHNRGDLYRMNIEGASGFSFCYYAPAESSDNEYCKGSPAINGFQGQGCENHDFIWSISTPLPPLPGRGNTPRYILNATYAPLDAPRLSGCVELTGDFYCYPGDGTNPNAAVTDTYIGANNFTITLEENPSCVFN